MYMKVLHINSEADSQNVDSLIDDNNNHVFVLVYMEGCGPCNATRPEWEKLENALSSQYAKNDALHIIDINKDYIGNVKKIGSIDGFPTMKYFHKGNEENYEDANIRVKDRTVDSFVQWVESKITNVIVGGGKKSSPENLLRRTLKKSKSMRKSRRQKGGKWSRKYKKSINCKKPKGFSQKQYCKYGRKK
jgi:thiol-disulfide isomerase/thioredoxin